MRLAVPLDSLLKLPTGASYTATKGRAKTTLYLSRTPGKTPVIMVESDCDSLERLCLYYNKENERLSVANSHLESTVQTEKEQRSNTPGTKLQIFIAGLMAGIITTILIRKIWQTVY